MSWGSGFLDWPDVAAFAVMYFVCGFGVTVGYHRLLTHGSFETKPWLRYAFAIAGSMGVQGAVIHWVADHRKHHAFSDQEGDPHSPYTHGGEGFTGAMAGLWHSHVGWLWEYHATSDYKRYARDLYEDPTMRRIHKLFPVFMLLSFIIPGVISFVLSGFNPSNFWTGMFWAASSASRCSSTSPGPSTRPATSSASSVSTATTTPRTSGGSPCRRSARAGTTTTTRSRAPLSTA